MTYAMKTTVSPEKTRAEIERTLAKYGAKSFAYGSSERRAMIGFETKDRRVRFDIPLVPPDSFTRQQAEQFVRSRWRAALLSIKAKLESVESGIETFDEAFMSHIVMPDGETMAKIGLTYIKDAYNSGKMPPLLSFNG